MPDRRPRTNVESAEHVNHADTVGHSEHVDSVGNMNITVGPNEPSPDQRKVLLGHIAVRVLTMLAIVLALAFSIVTLIDKNNVQQDADRDRKQFERRIEDLLAQIDATNKVNKEENDCVLTFSRLVTATSQENISGIGALVLALTKNESGSPERQAQIDTAVAMLEQAEKDSTGAIKAREEWVAAGRQLPCPIGDGTPPPPP